jgi:hypothetical protein
LFTSEAFQRVSVVLPPLQQRPTSEGGGVNGNLGESSRFCAISTSPLLQLRWLELSILLSYPICSSLSSDSNASS